LIRIQVLNTHTYTHTPKRHHKTHALMCIKIYVFIQHCIRKITAAPLYKLNLWHPIEYIVVEIHYITIEIF